MKTIKGPGIFLAQFIGPQAPFNTLAGIAQWAAGLGYKALQIPCNHPAIFDVEQAAQSQSYCDDVRGVLAERGVFVAANPASNMKLASGIARIPDMLKLGVPVGLGVDGSASNDISHLGLEARQAMLVARLQGGAAAMGAREALEIATLGGARVLGRSDIGALEPGKRADIVLWDVSELPSAGQWDPVAALIFCAPIFKPSSTPSFSSTLTSSPAWRGGGFPISR